MTAVESPTSATTLPAPSRQDIVIDRPSHRFGGMSGTLLRLELVRVLRNWRVLAFSLIMPVLFFEMFGNASYASEKYGNGNVAAYVMIGMALYGALLSTTGAGAAVSTERAMGWTRQLRLTPLSPVVYIIAKSSAGLVTGLLSVTAVYLAGVLGSAEMPANVWLATGAIVWFGSFVFVAFGLFMGYLLPSNNAMQVVGPAMALLAFLGGMFVPITKGSTLDHISQFTPMYGLHKLSTAPLGNGDFSWAAVANVLVWLVVFSGGAAWRMSKDTARV